jgi:hypothetical protein
MCPQTCHAKSSRIGPASTQYLEKRDVRTYERQCALGADRRCGVPSFERDCLWLSEAGEGPGAFLKK